MKIEDRIVQAHISQREQMDTMAVRWVDEKDWSKKLGAFRDELRRTLILPLLHKLAVRATAARRRTAKQRKRRHLARARR